MAHQNELMEKIVALCKRRGFIYQNSDIYGGFAGSWDYGPMGVLLANNIKALWWKMFVTDREDMYGLDSSIISHPRSWKASGHVDGFNDPLVEDLKTHKRYRADHILEQNDINPEGMSMEQMTLSIRENNITSPDGNELGDVKAFNMMFKTYVGALESEDSIAYLRPETAGGIFLNYKNIRDTMNPKLPFGIAQIGKAFRNEIAPRDFIFRVRELEQMEVEYFIHPSSWQENFALWQQASWDFIREVGIAKDAVYEHEIGEADRAHYSQKTIDFEFDFPFGRKELFGIAYRGDFDLSNQSRESGVTLDYTNLETKEKIIPHVIEPSMGLGRIMLALFSSVYTEDTMNDETRVYLKFPPRIAPLKIAVFPLLKNKPELVAKAREVYAVLKKKFGNVIFDDGGNIGKRYRKQDEIGTPFAITVDFESLEDDAVTVRFRDTGEQTRMPIADLLSYFEAHLS